MSEPPSYPTVPAYGSNRPTGNPFLGGAPFGTTGSKPERRSGSWLSVTMAVALNLITLVGVVGFGWPAGNVFLLFWAENAVLGIITLVKVASAQAPSTGGGLRINGRPTSSSPALYALFFTFHYGIFCIVHLVFTGIVAYTIGIRPTFFFLGFPLILIGIRYTVELLTTWFGPGGQRRTTSPSQAMAQPYPRIIVLHFAVLIGFGLVVGGMANAGWVLQARELFAPVLAALPVEWQTRGVLLVMVLLVIKTVVDVFTTRRATRTG